jgi:hypothetical protein
LPGDIYPRLTDIAGRCPPEDVGGFPVYEEFVDAMANTKHPEHAHLKEWYGGSFDPSTPPTDELRFDVLKLAKRWKPKNTIHRSAWGQGTTYSFGGLKVVFHFRHASRARSVRSRSKS